MPDGTDEKKNTVFGCRPYILKYKTGDEPRLRPDIYFGRIVIYASCMEEVEEFIGKHPLDTEYLIAECPAGVTVPKMNKGSEHRYHGKRIGMFFLDGNADVESPDEMGEEKFNFLYENLPSGCDVYDLENFYSKMFEEDNPDNVEQLHSFSGFENCIIDIERF